MDILIREDTKVVERTVNVKFADSLFKTNRHGTKIVKVFVVYSEDSGSLFDSSDLYFSGKCSLMKNNAGITWEFFSEKCTTAIAEMIVDMFMYQDLVDYISKLPC